MSFELSPEERELLPSADDVRFYREHGWFITPRIFSDQEIELALSGSERYYRGERDKPLPDGTWQWGWSPKDGDCLRKNDYSSLQNRELMTLVQKPLLAAIAAKLAGVDQIRLWHDQLLYKPPLHGTERANVGWHTDRGYWKAASSTRMLTAWVPFHDVDESNGTVHMIDQSHLWPDNTEHLDFFNPNLSELEKRFKTGGRAVSKVPMIMKTGQVSFHSCLTIHGSGANRTDRPRRSMAIHLQDGANRYSNHRYPDGKLAAHCNDRFVRRSDGVPDYADPALCPVLFGARDALSLPHCQSDALSAKATAFTNDL
jgi:Phytanoyl-CoA dioxygenase (PhyH)